MKKFLLKKEIIILTTIILIISSYISVLGAQTKKLDKKFTTSYPNQKYIEINLTFSDPEVVKHEDYWIVRVNETNHNSLNPGKPVLPVNISIYKLNFGSKILNVEYQNSTPETINLSGIFSFCKANYDNFFTVNSETGINYNSYNDSDSYPEDWIGYHTGGGLSKGERTTFLVLRVYPVRYYPVNNQLKFIKNIIVNITYEEPSEQVINDNDTYDLLIISPSKFVRNLQPLVYHKNKLGVRTVLVSLSYIYNQIWYGRDEPEKIKLFIKEAIEKSGIKYVLLIGGLKGPTFRWYLPVRYSYVVPTSEQEYPEQFFISDLYFADIYDSEGGFSSWDSNNDNKFSVWNETFKEVMDLYPDVYFGRLPCRNRIEVITMVKKIISYEKNSKIDEDWFKNFILVAGDSYNDTHHFNEGELISEEAIKLMPGFNPVRLYAREGQDINKKTVNNVMNKGASFAYFCGHGNPISWATHFPPDGVNWTEGYQVDDMIFLKNKNKQPIVVVGGCHNGQFDVTPLNLLKNFKDSYYHSTWTPRCWSWWLTCKIGGGAIATISNTGLGTHGDGDVDNNSIADYLEILDGWLELNFFKLYGLEKQDVLGMNHGDTLTGYLNIFLGDDTKMDVKMVQQWVLFGDPSLKIGGYLN
ncbi:MAG: C25 family cysteine peptidase [Candidatus Thermoplasmatota archaeon]|jgi:hypothetical protein|nr:C25 family cysteine peptidase [Candidatus Thermoplasmatota archaeon]